MIRPQRTAPVHDVQGYLEALALFMAAARDRLDDPTYARALPLLEQLRAIPEPRDPDHHRETPVTTDQPDLYDPDGQKPPSDLFAPDPAGRCLQCRAGSHRACRGRRQCRCTHTAHTDRQETQP